MQINNKYTIVITIVFISLFHSVFAQQNTDIINNLQNNFINNKQSFVNMPINEIINNVSFPIKGYSIHFDSVSPLSLENAKLNEVTFYFLPKKGFTLDDLLTQKVNTNIDSTEKVICLTVRIKNYEQFPFFSIRYYNPNGSDNWNDVMKSTFLSSGMIVEDITLYCN